MKIMLFCPDRHGPRDVLKILHKSNIEVVGCVCDELQPSLMGELCQKLRVPMFSTTKLYEELETGMLPKFDVGISYLYPRLLRESIIAYPPQGIINFHPAPVSVHKGVAACCYALLGEYDKWAVTAHYVAPKFDEGDVIEERWFDLPRGGGIHLQHLM